MQPDELRARQQPLKDQYRNDPDTARVRMQAAGRIEPETISCRIGTPRGPINAGLHPAAGGDGSWACSADMLLESLAACAGVTLAAVATAMGIPLRGGTVAAEGDCDFRGTLAVERTAPVGLTGIRLQFALDTDAPPEVLDKLLALTERYCVIFQTLQHPPQIEVSRS